MRQREVFDAAGSGEERGEVTELMLHRGLTGLLGGRNLFQQASEPKQFVHARSTGTGMDMGSMRIPSIGRGRNAKAQPPDGIGSQRLATAGAAFSSRSACGRRGP
ncbi:hypothetical protein GCM10007350_08920 [Jeongeupia chitinilytica]|uniref:Uncharacterized protein n=1 Tax=Jeongeupia chitinilytica TaxID=1041641 RepID=A0ABQ3GWK0_9NEIS|nr:hypothetical protein GCM10007350_08920 [Jeongeupia chitinilytica]